MPTSRQENKTAPACSVDFIGAFCCRSQYIPGTPHHRHDVGTHLPDKLSRTTKFRPAAPRSPGNTVLLALLHGAQDRIELD